MKPVYRIHVFRIALLAGMIVAGILYVYSTREDALAEEGREATILARASATGFYRSDFADLAQGPGDGEQPQ